MHIRKWSFNTHFKPSAFSPQQLCVISPVEPVFIFGNIIFLNTLGHIQTDWKELLTQFENRSKITNRSGIRFYGGEMDGHAKTTNIVLSPFCSSDCINLYSTLTGSFPTLNWLYSYNLPPYHSYRMSSNNALGATRWRKLTKRTYVNYLIRIFQ